MTVRTNVRMSAPPCKPRWNNAFKHPRVLAVNLFATFVFTTYSIACVLIGFFFSLLLIFTLLAASMSHFLTSAWNLLCTSSPLFFISRSSSFSIIPRQCRKLVKRNTGYDILRIKLVNRKFYVVVVQQQRQRKKVHCACKVFFFLLNRPVNFCRARHRCRFSFEQITSTVYEDIS